MIDQRNKRKRTPFPFVTRPDGWRPELRRDLPPVALANSTPTSGGTWWSGPRRVDHGDHGDHGWKATSLPRYWHVKSASTMSDEQPWAASKRHLIITRADSWPPLVANLPNFFQSEPLRSSRNHEITKSRNLSSLITHLLTSHSSLLTHLATISSTSVSSWDFSILASPPRYMLASCHPDPNERKRNQVLYFTSRRHDGITAELGILIISSGFTVFRFQIIIIIIILNDNNTLMSPCPNHRFHLSCAMISDIRDAFFDFAAARGKLEIGQ